MIGSSSAKAASMSAPLGFLKGWAGRRSKNRWMNHAPLASGSAILQKAGMMLCRGK
jgi:hypothetical protein